MNEEEIVTNETEEETPLSEAEESTPLGEEAPFDYLEMFEVLEDRPFLTTPFTAYSVAEGFLLLFLLCAFAAALYQVVRRFL